MKKYPKTKSLAFQKWFAGSKLAHDCGAPMVLYHGTENQIEAFASSERGFFGSGIYLTASKSDAEMYGQAMELYANVQRPFYTRADYDAGEEVDFDSPAVPFIRDVLGDQAEAAIHKSLWSDGKFGREVQQTLELMGHDGVIVRWPDGLLHVIAFYPSQIKSATLNTGEFSLEKDSIYE